MRKKYIGGTARLDRRTKDLCKRLKAGDIAIIDHKDLDEVAAEELLEKKVKAVVNACDIFSGEYPSRGARLLLDHGIYIVDIVGEEIFNLLSENDIVAISENRLYRNGKAVAQGRVVTFEIWQEKFASAHGNLMHQLDLFVQNTLEYAKREKALLLDGIKLPETCLDLAGRDVLVVVRGNNYKKDLRTVRPYIKEARPVLLGVDGGGDALLELGFKPHIVLGDMDSVRDDTLLKAREVIVHAYPDGRAPGLERVKKLGLKPKTIAVPGTSEDLALLLAYEKKARLIVAVGTHSHMIDFLEKGRRGMSSTFLVRLKVGERLVDARGLAYLYSARKNRYFMSLALLLAALFPIFILLFLSPLVRHLFHLFSLRFGLF